MKTKSTAVRLFGGLLMAVALLPWLGGTAAQAAVTVHVDTKWIGTSSTTAGVNHADCNYEEIKQAHTGTGWHFVLTGTTGLTSFTAYFNTGAVTVTTTETASGVIVQGGKGAVVYTSTAATLVAGPSTFPGDGISNGGEDIMQLSHICTGTPTTPPSTPVSTPVTTPASTPASTPAKTPPASVLPTKASSSPSTSVEAVKNKKPPAVLPKTGSGMSLGMALTVSFGLLLGGAALMFFPRGLTVEKGKRRRH